jgi:integrase
MGEAPRTGQPGLVGWPAECGAGFAAYLHSLDPSVPTIPPGLLPGRGRRAVPYLYSDEDLVALLRQTEALQTFLRTRDDGHLRRAARGDRAVLSEALAVDDLDVDAGMLLVRHGKFGKQRLLPLHPSAVEALTAYRTIRDGYFPIPVSPALLVSQAGTRLLVSDVELTFARLVHRAGSPRGRHRGARTYMIFELRGRRRRR